MQISFLSHQTIFLDRHNKTKLELAFCFLLLRLSMKKIKFIVKCYCLTVLISLNFNETKKNCFIYIALAKHFWVIKLEEFKGHQKYFAIYLRKSWKPHEIIATVWRLFTNVPTVGKNLVRALYRLIYLRFCDSIDQWKNTVQQRSY